MREDERPRIADVEWVALIERYDVRALPAIAWKNGGGTTREIACRPAGAGLDDFDWRVSIAAIAANGPFSGFPGVDRCIVLLRGGGVRIESNDGEIDHRLEVPRLPFTFDGGCALHVTLLGGESEDFNVMTRRGRVRADVHVVDSACTLRPASRGVVHAARGQWTLDGDEHVAGPLAAGQGIWWDGPTPGEIRLAPHSPAASLLAVDIVAIDAPEGRAWMP